MTPREMRDRREKLGLSRPDLARLIPVHRRTLDGWEQGVHRPGREAAAAWEAVLDRLERAVLFELLQRHGLPRHLGVVSDG